MIWTWLHNVNTVRCWKKQLNIAKDARRVDVLCYRIFLSYRLLEGSSRFRELHEIVRDAKAKLETEVGPVNGVSAKMARGIVSRLPVAGEVQKLCSLAIDKADEWLAAVSNKNPTCRGNSFCLLFKKKFFVHLSFSFCLKRFMFYILFSRGSRNFVGGFIQLSYKLI